MFERLVLRIKKGSIYRKISKAKRLLKDGKISEAEKKYKELLEDYNFVYDKATYFEKLSIHHSLMYIYDELEKRRRKEEKPVAVRTKEQVKKLKEEAARREAEMAEKKRAEERKQAEKKTQAEEKKQEEKHEEKPMESTEKEAIQLPKASIMTEFDELYSYVIEKGNVDLIHVSGKLKVPKEKIEEWAKILEEHGLMKIYYPAFTSPLLLSNEWIRKKLEEKRKEKEMKKKSKKGEAVLT